MSIVVLSGLHVFPLTALNYCLEYIYMLKAMDDICLDVTAAGTFRASSITCIT